MPKTAVKRSLASRNPPEERVGRDQQIQRLALPALALFLLTVITYIPSMTNGFIWDDPAYVTNNQTLKSPEGLLRIWTELRATPQFYPMVHTTFWIEAHLWGTAAAPGYHVDNILLHALAVVLLWRALLAIGVPFPAVAAAIFAVHPVMVESVAWITERKNVLSIVFYLLAFHAYRRSGLFGANEAADVHPRLLRNRWYIASLVLFLFALFSKTVTCSLPAAILLIIWWKRNRITWRDIKPLLPMFAMGLILSSITSNLEATHVGASGPDFQWSPIDRCLIAGHAICFYAMKLAWPHPLMFMYPRWDLHADRGLQFLYPAGVVLVVTGLWATRNKIGRGPLVAVLFFIGTLTPALGFVNVYPMRYSFVADHFQYLASIGIISLFTAVLAKITDAGSEVLRRTGRGTERVEWETVESRAIPTPLFVSSQLSPLSFLGIPPAQLRTGVWFIILAPLVILTWQQQHIYKNAFSLWQDTITQNQTSWMAHVNMASVYTADKNAPAALRERERAFALAPFEADTNYEMGYAFTQQGKWAEARDMFRRAIRYDPTCAPAWSYLARDLWDHFDTDEDRAQAYEAASRALKEKPDMNLPDAHYVLARVAESAGDYPKAIEEYETELAINDEDFYAHFDLGVCLLQTKHPDRAAAEFQKVLKHDPANASAMSNMGQACLDLGRTSEAIDNYLSALVVNPNLQPAKEGLKKAMSVNTNEHE